MKGLWLHIDCPSGIAGDMFVGAALDLGVPREVIAQSIRALGIGLEWDVREVLRRGMAGKKVHVHDEHDRPSRGAAAICSNVWRFSHT